MATAAPRKLFVNLAVEDLSRSVDFFTKLGFPFDQRFTDDTCTCMIINDETFAMLMQTERFQTFTKKQVCDSMASAEALLALSCDSRDEVDEMTNIALSAGGSLDGEPQDHGFMYGRSFRDPDGHTWEVVWMDPAAVPA